MPNFRKLDPVEVQTIENKGKGERRLTAELYDSILADYAVGEYGEATLDAGENRLTVRNRLKAAATWVVSLSPSAERPATSCASR